MEFKWINKQKFGIVATLFLVVLLSQARVFDFLFVTNLGRAILLLFIIGISGTSKILGTILVFLIIIMYSQSNIGLLEGYSLNSLTSLNARNANSNNKTTSHIPIPGSNYPSNITSGNENISSTKETIGGREGFNMIDRENTILRGKNSNQLPVFSNSRIQSGNIEPSDSLVYSSVASRF